MLKRPTRIVDRLYAQALATENETSAQRPSACPSNQPGAEHITFAEVLAVAIHIKYLGHHTSPYVLARNIQIPAYPTYNPI